jgi:hypothetical protein
MRMQQQDEIEALLHKAAPVCYRAARYAQNATAEIMDAEVVRKYLTRRAAANQVGGLANWRVAGDVLVRWHTELPSELRLSTTDAEQNQGLYYFRSARPAMVLTLRREPHLEKEEPKALQLQWASVLAETEVDLGGHVVTVYLRVPRLGQEPTFEVAARGEPLSYRLRDLIDGDASDESGGATVSSVLPKPPTMPPGNGAVVRSKDDVAREGQQEDASDSRR